MLNSKEKKLIKLLAQRNDWVSSSEIISSLSISLRTLRNMIKNINIDYKYIISSNKGYRMIQNSKVIEALLKGLDQRENTEDNRDQIILRELLLSKRPVNYFALSESLFISEQTLLSSITTLNKTLSPYNVMIIRHREWIELKGNENDIRRLFSDIVYKEVESGVLNISVLHRFFGDVDAAEIKSKILEVIRKRNFRINDFILNSIVLHICIIIDRRKYETEETIENKDVLKKDLPQYDCSVEIIQWIERKYQFQSGKNDLNVIYGLLLIGLKADDKGIGDADINNIIDPLVLALVKRIVASVYNEYYINLDNDEFISNFALHLNNVVNQRMVLKNPLLTSIKDAYPAVYEISVFIAKCVQDEYPMINMDDHQISYIALHVGTQIEKQAMSKIQTVVVNPQYLKLNALILSKLEANFSNDLAITVVSDSFQISEIAWRSIDLILTTVPLSESYDCMVVNVSVFISQRDIEKIFAAVSTIKKQRSFEKEYLLQYFDGTFCYFDINPRNYEEAVGKLCALHKDLDEDFLKRVLIREEMSPSEYLNIAVVHPIRCNEKSTFISVGIFKKSFRWRKNDINIVFLLSVSQQDKNNFLKILRHLIEIFSSSKWMEQHGAINTYEKFVRFIKENSI